MEEEFYAEYYPDYEESDDSDSNESFASRLPVPSEQKHFDEDHYGWDNRIMGRNVMLNKEGYVVFRDEDPDASGYMSFDSNDSEDDNTSGYRTARTTKVLRQSAQTITDAINGDMSLPEIEDIIKKEHLPTGGFAACFRRMKERFNLFKAVFRRSTVDFLELVLENGVNANTTFSKGSHEKCTTVQMAVEHGNLEAIAPLVKHGAVVDSALITALKKDDPELMKPLYENYYGKTPALLLALDLGAAKCAEILIEDEKQQEEIKARKIPLYRSIRYGVKLIPKLYEIGCSAGKYHQEDLNDCLISLLNVETYHFTTRRVPSDLDQRIRMLIELGADVNCTVKRYFLECTLFEVFLAPFRVYGVKQEQAIFSLLLEHGANASPSSFRKFVCNQTNQIFYEHTLKQKGTMTFRQLVSLTEETLSMVKKVSGVFCSRNGHTKSLEFFKFLGPCALSDLLVIKGPESPHCKEMVQLIYDAVLTFDLTDSGMIEYMGSLARKCNCVNNITETLMLLQTNYLYQKHLKIRDSRHVITPEQREELLPRFPQVRTLLKLAHVEILNSLRFPKRKSVESLILPKLLKDLICLVQ